MRNLGADQLSNLMKITEPVNIWQSWGFKPHMPAPKLIFSSTRIFAFCCYNFADPEFIPPVPSNDILDTTVCPLKKDAVELSTFLIFLIKRGVHDLRTITLSQNFYNDWKTTKSRSDWSPFSLRVAP